MSPLFLPRKLAIRLLAAAQNAADAGNVHGFIGAVDDVPSSVHPDDDDALERMRRYGETCWAHYRTPTAPAGDWDRELVISVDTKGVLQLACFERVKGQRSERELKIRD